jgi:hypothetical protein
MACRAAADKCQSGGNRDLRGPPVQSSRALWGRMRSRANGRESENGSPSWIRTNDQVINSHLLYR